MEETVSAPFKYVLVKARVNARKIDALTALGVRVIERTDVRALAIQADHAAQRGRRHYVRLGERMNAAGQTLGDSGICRIKFNPDNPKAGEHADASKAMTLEHVGADLLEIGYVLTDVHILQRPGEKNGMGFLVMVFQIGETPTKLSAELADQLDTYVDGFYRSVFVWENPDGSCTINANQAVVGNDLDRSSDRRTLRFAWADNKTSWRSASYPARPTEVTSPAQAAAAANG